MNIDFIYPVGSIYISTNSTNPSKYFGGTWAQFGSGKTLVGVDSSDDDFLTAEKTGGEKKHQLSRSELPYTEVRIKDPSYNWLVGVAGYRVGGSGSYPGITGLKGDTADSQKLRTEPLGGGASHNNLQPYITVYMWKRTA